MESYAGKVKALAIVWFIYAGFSFFTGIAALTFAQTFFHRFGNWNNGPWLGAPGYEWFGWSFMRSFLPLAWAVLVVRTCLAVMAGWGLFERAQWGRVVAIVAAVFILLKFPVGTVLGVWTLVVLLGYRNTTLYNQL